MIKFRAFIGVEYGCGGIGGAMPISIVVKVNSLYRTLLYKSKTMSREIRNEYI